MIMGHNTLLVEIDIDSPITPNLRQSSPHFNEDIGKGEQGLSILSFVNIFVLTLAIIWITVGIIAWASETKAMTSGCSFLRNNTK
jgi:hypothetical protein